METSITWTERDKIHLCIFKNMPSIQFKDERKEEEKSATGICEPNMLRIMIR